MEAWIWMVALPRHWFLTQHNPTRLIETISNNTRSPNGSCDWRCLPKQHDAVPRWARHGEIARDKTAPGPEPQVSQEPFLAARRSRSQRQDPWTLMSPQARKGPDAVLEPRTALFIPYCARATCSLGGESNMIAKFPWTSRRCSLTRRAGRTLSSFENSNCPVRIPMTEVQRRRRLVRVP